jgi:hypothetical protein
MGLLIAPVIILGGIYALRSEPVKYRYWFFLKHNVSIFIFMPFYIVLLLSIFFIRETVHIWKTERPKRG